MADPEILHLVARAAAGARPFEQRRACADLWAHLARSFDMVACVLMPNHVHVLAQLERDVATRAFARVLAAFRLRTRTRVTAPVEFEWEPIPRPEKVQRDKRHIARTVRYIHLNPTRDGLCDDPVEWEWSTHRDWLGAVARPCVDRSRWARAMGRRPSSCPEWLHEYVSSDASVRGASPLADPHRFLAEQSEDVSIDSLARATACVLRSGCTALAEFGPAERRLFLLSAARWTHYRPPELARHVYRHRTNVWKMMRIAEERAAAAKAHGSAVPSAEVRSSSETEARSLSKTEVRSLNLGQVHSLHAAELTAMALVLADRRLWTTQLRGAVPEPATQARRSIG